MTAPPPSAIPFSSSRNRLARVAVLCAIGGGLALAATSGHGLPGLGLSVLRDPLLGPPLAALGIVAGSLAMVPMLAMIAMTATLFDPPTAFFTTLVGALAAAGLQFWAVRLLGREPIRRRWSRLLARVDRLGGRHGLMSVALLRATPVAPFTVVNIAAGLSRIGFTDFLAGTAAGLSPSIIAYGVIGRRLPDILSHPTAADTALLLAVALTAAALGWIAGRLLGRSTPARTIDWNDSRDSH
jgi:phospholipase D1/2